LGKAERKPLPLLRSILARDFIRRARVAFPRDIVTFGASAAAHPRFGAFAALGAIALGAVLMIANGARDHAAARLAAAAPPLDRVAVARTTPKSEPTPIAAAAPLPPATEKMRNRVDVTPIASIPKPQPATPRHRPHRRKLRRLDKEF